MPIQASHGAWPHSYHRVLNGAFLGVLFALGVLLGTVVSGYAGSHGPASLPSHPSLHTPLPATPLDARFAVVTLGIECLRNLCDAPDGSEYVPVGQRVHALLGGWAGPAPP